MSYRIVSLVPSCTEIVCALGRRVELVGRSHECDFPADVQSLPICTRSRISSEAPSGVINDEVKAITASGAPLYEIDSEKLASLRPDVILTQGQCNVCAVSLADVERAVAAMPGHQPKIVATGAIRIADLWTDILAIADAIGANEEGRELLSGLKNRVVDVLQKTCAIQRRQSVACLEWLDPLMAAGNWIPELVDFAGGKNLFGEAGQHSPWLQWAQLIEKNPDMIVLMPCGFSLERTRQEAAVLLKNPEWRKLRAVKSKNVFITDGSQYFNRPGPRLVDSLEILGQIIWPKLFGTSHEGKGWARLPSV